MLFRSMRPDSSAHDVVHLLAKLLSRQVRRAVGARARSRVIADFDVTEKVTAIVEVYSYVSSRGTQ